MLHQWRRKEEEQEQVTTTALISWAARHHPHFQTQKLKKQERKKPRSVDDGPQHL
jgi:hypothetical protein